MINDKKVYQKRVSKPNFISPRVIDKNSLAVHCSKCVLTLIKPLYAGFCILEISKLKMYQFHYDWTLKTFKGVNLLFTDTDSLIYEIRVEMFMIFVIKISTCLVSVDIPKILNIFMIQTKK